MPELISILWLAVYIILLWIVIEILLRVAQLLLGPLAPNIVQAIRLILAIIVLIWIITFLFGMGPAPPFPRR